MALHRITRGLDLPLDGRPAQAIEAARAPSCVALVATDYPGMRPQMQVVTGDAVQRGQLLFEDKRTPGVSYTAPGSGRVRAIHRGERRVLLSVVIELSESERQGPTGEGSAAGLEPTFDGFAGKDPGALSRDEVKALLLESGLWTAIRARPFGRVPLPDSGPRSIFVTAIDTQPLAADVDVVLEGNEAAFAAGVRCVAKLTDGKTFVCHRAGSRVADSCPEGVQREEFSGPHPAGSVGLHIHLLDPVHRNKTVWHLDYQDAIAIGKLFQSGRLDPSRVVSVAGPQAKSPRLLRTRLGASLDEILLEELAEGENRVISGSVLSGRSASGERVGYLGRYHSQVTALREGRERELLGWMAPGRDKFSILPMFTSRLFGNRNLRFTTNAHGSSRAIVPVGLYERVFPFDILPTPLLRSLAVEDIEEAERLGCLELDEEDLALCSFVDTGKADFGQLLRKNLERIEKEG